MFSILSEKLKNLRNFPKKEIKMIGHRISFSDNLKNWNLVDVFVHLVRCHGNWYDVTSNLKV